MNHLPGKVELPCYQSSHQHCQCSSSVVIVILSSMMPHSQEEWIFWSIPRDMINDERMSIVRTPPKLGRYWEINPLISCHGWLAKTVSGRVTCPSSRLFSLFLTQLYSGKSGVDFLTRIHCHRNHDWPVGIWRDRGHDWDGGQEQGREDQLQRVPGDDHRHHEMDIHTCNCPGHDGRLPTNHPNGTGAFLIHQSCPCPVSNVSLVRLSSQSWKRKLPCQNHPI